MTTDLDDEHLSERSLDLLLLGRHADQEGEEASRARSHVGACPACRSHLDSLRRSAEYFDQNVRDRTEGQVLAALEERTGAPPRTRRRWELTALGLAAATAAVVLVTRGAPRRPDAREADLRSKGDASLTVFRRHAGSVSVLSDGARVEPGDSLRFLADPAGYRWLLVLSLDGGGRSTVYLPYGGSASRPIDPLRRFEDDGSITLDETRGPERIFALFSDQPIAAAEAIRALGEIAGRGPEAIRSTRHLLVTAGSQTSLLLEK